MEYRVRAAGGDGSARVEVLGVSRFPDRVEASCRRVGRGPGGPDSVRDYRVVVDARGVRGDGELEFPLPGAPGQSWSRPPRDYSVESLTGTADTPAGRFTGCLVVGYTIAGGDAGFGKRYY